VLIDYENAYKIAAGGGHLQILKWLRDNDDDGAWGSDDPFATSEALENGHWEAFQWLVEQGAPFDDTVMLEALGTEGALDKVRWMRDPKKVGGRVIPWPNEFMFEALCANESETARWALDNGCVFDPVLLSCLNNDDYEIAKWLLSVDFGWDKSLEEKLRAIVGAKEERKKRRSM
jgi:hypothetical protein